MKKYLYLLPLIILIFLWPIIVIYLTSSPPTVFKLYLLMFYIIGIFIATIYGVYKKLK